MIAILNTILTLRDGGAPVPPPPTEVQWQLITTNWEAESRDWETIL